MYIRVRRINCGHGCEGCPHGPYAYAEWWKDGKKRSKYLGRVANGDDADEIGKKHGYALMWTVNEAVEKFKAREAWQ